MKVIHTQSSKERRKEKTRSRANIRTRFFRDGGKAVGDFFDVVVDVRPQSETYLKYETFLLSDKDETFILVPKGFAHGFQTLVDNVELLYFHDHPHCPQSEVIINPNDPSVGVEWPLRPSKIAEKDRCKEFL